MSLVVVLPLGPDSISSLLPVRDKFPSAIWTSYDPRTSKRLSLLGIENFDGTRIFDGKKDQVRTFENLALDLACSWYLALPSYGGIHVESLFIRYFYFYFLILLRGYIFLKGLAEQFQGARILTIDCSEVPSHLRWHREESPLPILLKTFSAKLGLDYEFAKTKNMVDGKPAHTVEKNQTGTSALSSFLLDTCQAFLSSQRADLLYVGNPALLKPVFNSVHKRKPFIRIKGIRRMHALPDIIRCLWSSSAGISAGSAGSQCLTDIESVKKRLSEDKTFLISGEDFMPVVWPRIELFYKNEYAALAHFYGNCRKKIHTLKPACIVFDEDVTPHSKAIALAAKQQQVKSLVVEHGLPGLRHGFYPLTADHMAVWGEKPLQRLSQWGISENRMIITGNPKYSQFSGIDLNSGRNFKNEVCEKFGLNIHSKMIVITPNGTKRNALERYISQENVPAEDLLIAEAFLSMALKFQDISFIYKFHAGSWDKDIFHDIAASFGGLPQNFRWVDFGKASDYMMASDFVFSGWSSATLEAALLKKPLAVLHFENYPPVHPFADCGIKKISSSHQLEEILSLIRSGDRRIDEYVLRKTEDLNAIVLCNTDASANIADILIKNLKRSYE